MSRDDDIIASVRSAVERRLPAINEAVQNFRSQATSHGAYLDSRTILGTHQKCIDGYRTACAAATTQLAEIEGDESARLADSIATVLREVQPQVIEIFGWRGQGGRESASLRRMADESRAALQNEMNAEVDHITRDLQLGMAGGMNVKRRQQLYIDNRGGAGQFAIDSPGATQAIGRDQTAGVSDFSSLAQLMAEARQQIVAAGLFLDDREAVEDTILAVEREITQSEPDQGRVKRLVFGVAKAVRDVGVSVTGQAVTPYAKTQGWM